MARILALTSRVPWPATEGHQLRSWHVLAALAERHDVTLLSCLRGDDRADADDPLRARLAGFEAQPIASERSRGALTGALARSLVAREPFVVAKYASPALKARVAQLATRADAIHVDMLPLLSCVPEGTRVPVVLNAHNVEHRLLQQRAAVERHAAARAFLRLQVPLLRRYEIEACRSAATVLACSEPDGAMLRALAPMTPVHVVPNGVDLESHRPAPPTLQKQLVFVGQMGWFPNREGVEWFLARVLPRILAHHPDCRFTLVGKTGGLAVPAAVAHATDVTGFVPDVRPPVHAASVYVVPLLSGSGTRLKVLEAMALGKAIVTTTIGSEGIALRDGEDALFADDAQAFAAAVGRLLDAPAEVARLGAAARRLAEDRYGWDAIGRSLLGLYDDVLARSA